MGNLALKPRRNGAFLSFLIVLVCLLMLAMNPFSFSVRQRASGLKTSPDYPIPITSENAANIRELKSVTFNPYDLVLALAWSPDGNFLAASVGTRVVILSAESLQVVDSIEIGSFSRGIAFNAQGNLLAIGSQDGFVRIWQVEYLSQSEALLTQMAEYLAHRKGVNALEFSSLEDVLVTAGNDAVVRLWRPLSGELIHQIIGGTYAVPAVQFIPRMNSLALLNGEVIRLRDAQAGNILGSFRQDTWFYSLAYHPTKDVLAAGDINNLIYLWEIDQAYRSGKESFPEPLLLMGHSGKANTYHSLIWSVAFNASGDLLASAGGDGTVILWNLETFSMVMVLQGHRRGVTSAVFAPRDHYLASASLDGSIRLWGISP